MRIPAGRLGVGTMTNSTVTAARRWYTAVQFKVAAGTRKRSISGAVVLLNTIENVILNACYPSSGTATNIANASANWGFSGVLPTAGPTSSQTVTVKENSATLNHVVYVSAVFIGTPKPTVTGA